MHQIAPEWESHSDANCRVLLENEEARVLWSVSRKTGEYPYLEGLYARHGESNEFYRAVYELVWHEG